MKKWNVPTIEELDVRATANGDVKSDDYDGDWVQIDGKWYVPGGNEGDDGEEPSGDKIS